MKRCRPTTILVWLFSTVITLSRYGHKTFKLRECLGNCYLIHCTHRSTVNFWSLLLTLNFGRKRFRQNHLQFLEPCDKMLP